MRYVAVVACVRVYNDDILASRLRGLPHTGSTAMCTMAWHGIVWYGMVWYG